MDKLKQIFSPGSAQEDEVKYGSAGGSHDSSAPQLQTDPDAQNKSHGIGRQILNPQGEKYSEQSYGRTASVGNDVQQPPPAGTLQTQHEVEKNNQGGVLRQVLNPSGEKYSELGHDTTTAVGSAAQPALPGSNPSNSAALPISNTLETDHEAEKKDQGGELRQILSPHGDKYSEQSYGTTTTQTPGQQTSTGMNHSLSTPADDNASVLSIESRAEGPYAPEADTTLIGADHISSAGASTSRTSAQTSTQAPQDSREWRDSTLAGIGAATTTGGLASSGGIQRENRADDVSDSTYTARSYPLPSGVAGEPQGPDRTVLPTDSSNAPASSSSDHIRDDSLAGAGTIIGAGGVGASELAVQQNKPGDPEVANATYTDRAYPVGGSATGGAVPDASTRQILPHVPGEFPTESGYDPHMPGAFPQPPAGGSSATGPTYLDYGGMMSGSQPTATTESSITPGGESSPIMTTTNSVPRASFSEPAPIPAQDESHTGRDAAFVGGVGAGSAAAGYGIYNATRGDDTRDQVVQDRSVPATTSTGPSATHTTYSGPSQSSRTDPTDESHLGRNTAIAGGTAAAGGAGYGDYEATRGDSVRDQAQQASGPSQTTTSRSTVAEPSRTERTGAVTGNEHTGPLNSHKHDPANQQSTSTNMADLTRVEPTQPARTEQQQDSNFGRNTAIAGGATAATGAAGYGLYEATRGDDANNRSIQDRSAPATTDTITDMGSSKGPLNSHKHDPNYQQSQSTSTTGPTNLQSSQPASSAPQDQSNFGRNAAIAGGATGVGAAGYGLYDANRGDNVTGQATQDRSAPPTTGNTISDLGSSGGPLNSHKHSPDHQQSTTTSTTSTQPTTLGSTQPARREPEESHTGRNAALAGGAAAGTGAAGYGLYEATNRDEQTSSGLLNSHKHDPNYQQSSSTITQPATSGSTQPTASAYSEPRTQPEESHTGRNAALAGGAAAAGTGAAGYGLSESTNREQQSTGGLLDFHKQDPSYQQSRDTFTPSTTSGSAQPTTTGSTQPRTHPEESHTGRNAAYAGGATAATGAAGYGVYEATRRNDVDQAMQDRGALQQQQQQQPSTMDKLKEKFQSDKPKEEKTKTEKHKEEKPKHDKHHEEKPKHEKTTTQTLTKDEVARSDPTRAQQPADTHYGRDAAIVGGTGAAAGAAGYGIYEGTRDDRTDTGPASKTIGPHESNVANVMDPRVKPEPEKMKEKEPITTGPYRSDMANMADPRVKQAEQSNYSREAGVVGGTGAAAGGASYGASEANRGDSIREKALRNPDAVQSTPGQAYGTTDPSALSTSGSAQPASTNPEDSHTGRNATYAGGATAATGAAGYGAYEAGKDRETDPSRSSAESSSNKVSTDDKGHHHLHKKGVEQQGEKKPTLLQKILHPNKTKHEQEEREAARRSFDQPGHSGSNPETELVRDSHGTVVGTQGYVNDPDPSHHGKTHPDTELVRGSDGAVAGTQGYVDERGSQPTAAALHHDGMITLVHAGSHPDAPHVVVRDHPDA